MAKKAKKIAPVAKNLEQADEFLSEMGQAQQAIDDINAELTAEVEKLKKEAAAKAKIEQDKIDDLLEGLFAFAHPRKAELTAGGPSKTVHMPSGGELRWRTTPSKVNISNTEKVLATLKSLGLRRFIRQTPTIDKEAMLKEPQVAVEIPGVTITQIDMFVAAPLEVKAEISSRVDKLTKATK